MQLTKNFKFEEYFISAEYPELAQKGYEKVKDDEEIIRRIKHHAWTAAQPIRDHINSVLEISSGYRDMFLNEAVGGSKTSDHKYGMAADLWIPSKSNDMNYMEALFKWAIVNLDYRQIIWYPQASNKFIHTSINWCLDKNPEDKPFLKEAKVQFDGKYILADEFFRKEYLN